MNSNPYEAPRYSDDTADFVARNWIDMAGCTFLASVVMCLAFFAFFAELVHDTHGSSRDIFRPGPNAPRGGESAPAQTPN